jgi:hypothetical protein
MAGGIRVKQGKVTVELDDALSRTIDAMLREMAPTVATEMDKALANAEAYVKAEYPRANDSRFKTATGNSFGAFRFVRTIEKRGDATIIAATIDNDASNYGKISLLRSRRAELQAAFDRGETLSPEDLRELRVIQALEKLKGRQAVIPYVVFVHRGRYWQHLRRMLKDTERAIVEAAAAELRRLAGG